MPAAKGTRPPNAGKGRKPGSVNKVNADLRQMILNALSAAGGETYLKTQAKDNPSAFMALIGKCLPKDVIVNATITHASQLSDERLADIATGGGARTPETTSGPTQSPPVH